MLVGNDHRYITFTFRNIMYRFATNLASKVHRICHNQNKKEKFWYVIVIMFY